MNNYSKVIEAVASGLLQQQAEPTGADSKPNYTSRDFVNTVFIFQTALMDKMYDLQENENMQTSDRFNMATSCGQALRALIHTYTGLDTHNIVNDLE